MRGVSKDGSAFGARHLMVETREDALLTMRTAYATWTWISAEYSGSASQITRLRPLRLAA